MVNQGIDITVTGHKIIMSSAVLDDWEIFTMKEDKQIYMGRAVYHLYLFRECGNSYKEVIQEFGIETAIQCARAVVLQSIRSSGKEQKDYRDKLLI